MDWSKFDPEVPKETEESIRAYFEKEWEFKLELTQEEGFFEEDDSFCFKKTNPARQNVTWIKVTQVHFEPI